MKQVLLKRNGSTTMLPANESISMIWKLLDEKKEGKKQDRALVKQFLSELREHGVKLRDDDKERTGNHHRLELRKVGLEVSLHRSTEWGWWGVSENYIEKVEKWGDPWGVIFLTPEERFWVAGCNFRAITGDLDQDNGYNLHSDKLKELSQVKRFSTVSEFLLISGLSE